ncbi:HEAT repeat domain-containing protein [Pannonibacter sp.]|uniref:HEAT repeat domain-containing protein n=1 Tax=Pannonibacter sp. TaxID=1906786 RepID=UPI003F71F282
MAAAIDEDRKAALSRGDIASSNLAEILAIDFRMLMETLAPGAGLAAFEKEGISRRMALCGGALLDHCGAEVLSAWIDHRSDTVRGLALFGLARLHEEAPVADVLAMVRPFAADGHFGVREWAWLAVRPRLVRDLDQSIAALTPWTGDPDVNIRRFAVEALRPRGVWCKHISALREDPAKGLPLLEPMRRESEKYAQDSVANWLNDAAKDQPDWVRALCRRWLTDTNDCPPTRRITTRALRSLK